MKRNLKFRLGKILDKPCLECNRTSLTYTNEFVVCNYCGITYDKLYTDHLPVKYDEDLSQISHNSASSGLHLVSPIGSEIGKQDEKIFRDHSGNKIKPQNIQKYSRLINYHHKAAKYDNKTVHLRTMRIFKQVTDFLGITSTAFDRAVYLYWQYVNGGYTITNHVLLIAFCLLRAVRENKESNPYSFSEIIKVFKKRGHRVTISNMKRMARTVNYNFSDNISRSSDYFERIIGYLKGDPTILDQVRTHFSDDVESFFMYLLHVSIKFDELVSRKERGGVRPYQFAATQVYISGRYLSSYFELETESIITYKDLSNTVPSISINTMTDHMYRFASDLYDKYEDQIIRFLRKKETTDSEL